MAALALPEPVNRAQANRNPLRPTRLSEVIGQDRMKALMSRVIRTSMLRRVPLDHVLLVGSAGLGKTTLATVLAEELAVDCFQVQAPVSHETLLLLRRVMRHDDVLLVDEIHQQAIMERRGRSSSTQPEVLYHIMEDRVIVTETGVLPFPKITVVGATTDEGMLPDAFLRRFPLKPVLEPYTGVELSRIAKANADVLGVELTWEAALIFARASRGTPGAINNYVRNGAMLGDRIGPAEAEEVVRELNRTTDDGLTLDMQRTLVFIHKRGKRTNRATGETTYQASVGTIATALGKSRDAKAIQLRVEPYLIEKGYLQVGHGGRTLTPSGIRRAQQLSKEGVK